MLDVRVVVAVDNADRVRGESQVVGRGVDGSGDVEPELVFPVPERPFSCQLAYRSGRESTVADYVDGIVLGGDVERVAISAVAVRSCGLASENTANEEQKNSKLQKQSHHPLDI